VALGCVAFVGPLCSTVAEFVDSFSLPSHSLSFSLSLALLFSHSLNALLLTPLSHFLVVCTAKLRNLQSLDLGRLSASGCQALDRLASSLSSLQKLELFATNISPEVALRFVQNNRHLRFLSLEQCRRIPADGYAAIVRSVCACVVCVCCLCVCMCVCVCACVRCPSVCACVCFVFRLYVMSAFFVAIRSLTIFFLRIPSLTLLPPCSFLAPPPPSFSSLLRLPI
jgi:hypothetical protein